MTDAELVEILEQARLAQHHFNAAQLALHAATTHSERDQVLRLGESLSTLLDVWRIVVAHIRVEDDAGD